MNKFRISVIITTFKREFILLNEAIESVKNQSYQPIEIIIVDDNGIGSSYQKENQRIFGNDRMIKYIPNEKNFGAQYSRNIGIKNSEGEIIAFLDDDDLWEKHKLEKQILYFNDNGIGMVFSQGYTFIDGCLENMKIYSSSAKFIKEPSFENLLKKDCIGTTSQALIRRDVFDTVGKFDVDLPARQDYEMWIRISKMYRIVGVEEKLFYHRIHKSEQISKNPEKAVIGYMKIIKKYQNDYNKHHDWIAYKYYLIFKMYIKCNNYFKSIKYGILIIKHMIIYYYNYLKK